MIKKHQPLPFVSQAALCPVILQFPFGSGARFCHLLNLEVAWSQVPSAPTLHLHGVLQLWTGCGPFSSSPVGSGCTKASGACNYSKHPSRLPLPVAGLGCSDAKVCFLFVSSFLPSTAWSLSFPLLPFLPSFHSTDTSALPQSCPAQQLRFIVYVRWYIIQPQKDCRTDTRYNMDDLGRYYAK